MSKSSFPAPVEPEIRKSHFGGDTVEVHHPSFATIGVTHVQSSHGVDLFGSKIKVSSLVRVSINRAHMVSGNTDWPSEESEIISVEMSEAAFAEFISHHNRGTGTPATITRGPEIGSKLVPYPAVKAPTPEERIRKRLDRSVLEELERITNAVSAVNSIVDGDGAISKRALKDAMRTLNAAVGNLPSNLEHIGEVLNRDVGNLLHEAKIELNARAFHAETGLNPIAGGKDIGFLESDQGVDER